MTKDTKKPAAKKPKKAAAKEKVVVETVEFQSKPKPKRHI